MKNSWNTLGAGAALMVLLTVATYIPAMRAGYIWDDQSLIVDNPLVKAGDGLYRFWCTTEAPDYYPLTSSLWWLEWRLCGSNPMGYHVVNVLLHAVNAVLVWMILRRLKIPGAWFAGLVFAVHPVNAAAVYWISEQKTTLSMLFYAVAILTYLRFDEEGRLPRTFVRGWYGLSLVAFLLALLSKSAVVMLPVVLLGCVWWTQGRVRWKDFLRTVPFFILSLVLGLVTIWFQYNRATEGHAHRTAGFASRLAGAGWVPWFYLHKALLPVNLTLIYPHWEINAARWISWVPGMVLVGGLALFWWNRGTWGRPLLFGIGYFVVTLFPVLGFIDQGFYLYSLVADHWQYYSIVGAIALTVAAWEWVCRQKGGQGRYLGNVAGVAVLTILAVATWSRGSVFANSHALWRDNLAKNPNSWVAHFNIGIELEQADSVQEAIGYYEQALRIKPDFVRAHNNLGHALTRLGRVHEAIQHWEQALRIKPDYAEVDYNLGLTLWQAGRREEAIEHYEQALRSKPDFAEAHNDLGLALAQAGRIQEAIEHYVQALRAKPDYAEAHNNLGNALAQGGKIHEAIGHYEQALRIKPDYAEAHNNLGNALAQAGRIQEAVGQYEQALRIKPDYASAHINLGSALQLEGKLQDALEQYEEALRIKPDSAEASNNLARLRSYRDGRAR